MKNLSVLLPSYNRPYLLTKTINSFLKLNLKESQLVIIDQGTNIENIHNGTNYNLNYIIDKYNGQSNVVIKCIGKKISWEDQFSIYLENSKNFQYFSIISDDDLFLKNNCIALKIDALNKDSSLSFAISSAYMFELNSKIFWKRAFTNKNGRYDGKQFIEKFIKEESLQHSTVTGIFRINNMNKTDCFKILDYIKDNDLQPGYGLDTRLYFRNATLGSVLIIGGFKTRAIRFHNDGMTYKQPIESSYCYYWNVIDNINYLENKGLFLKNKNVYLDMWIRNILGAHIINIFFFDKEINYPKILNLLKKNYINFIQEEIKFNKIKLTKKTKKILFYNKLLMYCPQNLLVQRKDHFIPKNIFDLMINTKILYPIKGGMIYFKNKINYFKSLRVISTLKKFLKNFIF